MERVGIFGGTFDPPHRAHLAGALTAVEELQLSRLLWIPAARSPHKQDERPTDAVHRVEMTRLLVAQDDRFGLDTTEVDAGGLSFTVDTLEHLHASHPDWRLWLIIGQDQFEALPSWRDPERLRTMARVAVYRRDTTVSPAPEHRPPDVWLPGARMMLSATDIRRRLTRGEDMDDVLLPEVADYIHHHRLYLPG
ncbi:MAG: nicotinate (nicotinamide) nucleotide adenylyltransferase [Bacteroidetes bacterium]|nr:nicotinate (nicotinamide) nucleotide adenylyltransferase [Bacteroidota bacterium]